MTLFATKIAQSPATMTCHLSCHGMQHARTSHTRVSPSVFGLVMTEALILESCFKAHTFVPSLLTPFVNDVYDGIEGGGAQKDCLDGVLRV